MTLSSSIWYLILIGCALGVARECIVSVRHREFTTGSAGWMMVYIGSAVLALQPLLFPASTAPAAARAYVNGGGAVLVIGLLMALSSRLLRKRQEPGDIRSVR